MIKSFLLKLLPKLVSPLLGIGLLTAGLIACVKEVSSEHIPSLDQQPVVFGFISPQDTLLIIKLSWSRPGLNQLSFQTANQLIADATVTLIGAAGSLLFQYSSSDSVYVGRPNPFRIEVGKTYQLSVRLATGQLLKSSCTVPQAIAIEDTRLDSARSSFGQGYDYFVQSHWQDPAGVTNYYRFAGQQTYKKLINEAVGTVARERQVTASLDYGSVFGANLLTDSGMDGQRMISSRGIYTRYYAYDPGNSASTTENQVTQRTKALRLTVRLLNVEKSYYDYHKALALYEINEDNPFSEPVLVPSNIQGGLGCFSAYNQSSITLQAL